MSVLKRLARTSLALAVLTVLAGLVPVAGEAAIMDQVYTATVSMPNSATATQVTLPTTVDITRAFVLCSTRTANNTPQLALYSCALNNGGAGGTPRLTITPSAAPGNLTTRVTYYVATFAAGVSVQRGAATFSGTNLTPTAAPVFTSVDCTQSFVLISVRSDQTGANADERARVRATLGTAASPCTTTTTSLELTRLEGSAGTTLTAEWQVVTYEGASVQRGTSCIGGAAATPPCPTAAGATNGRNNRVTLATAVDTTKTFILHTWQGGTAIAGVEGEYLVRSEFLATGASVTGVEFERALTVTNNNRQVQISYEVVSLADGSAVQGSGTAPTTIANGTASSTPNFTTVVDTTRTVPFFSVSGGDAGGATRLDDMLLTGVVSGSNGGTQSEFVLTRLNTNQAVTVAFFAVSFYRCTPPSGVSYDTLCTLGVSTTGTQATVHWSSVNPVLLVAGTAPVTFTPVNGTTYTAGQVFGADFVSYSGSVATDTSYTGTGLTAGTTYYFTVWAKAGPAGACDTPPCYVAGSTGTVTPRSSTAWSSIVVGGAALNPAVAGTGRMSFGSNAGKLVSVDSATGAWTGVPASTVSPVQGYVTVFPYNGGEAVVGGDQSGWVYSVDQATGSYNWIRKLNADAIQAPLSIYSRYFFGANAGMAAAYPGTYDIIFAATANNTGAGGFTNNKVFALRSDTGAVLWTFSPATLLTPLCPTGCPMDQVVGQPWVDIERARLYLTSGSGAGGTQDSIWALDLVSSGLLGSGVLLARLAGGDITSAPSQSFDLASLWVGNEAGVLNIVDLNALTLTQNTVASGLVYKGFVWEDFNTLNRLYFVTTDGFVRALATPTSSSFAWSTRPVAAGTVAQLLPGFTSLWVGGTDGRMYQLNLTTGAQEGSAFVVGAGSLTVGPITTETGDELYAATSDGTVYKVNLSGGNLP